MTHFESSLERLRRTLGDARVSPLSSEYYSQSHHRFEQASNQQNLLHDYLTEQLERCFHTNQKPLSVLSVGCGGGQLDLKVVRNLGAKIASFTGVDSSADQLSVFRSSLTSSDPVALTHADFMQCNFRGEFDAAYSIHVLYYTSNPYEVIVGMHQSLKMDGLCLVALAPLHDLNKIAEVFWRPTSGPVFFSEELQRLIENTHLNICDFHRIDAHFPLARVVGPEADKAILDFAIQADTGKLSEDARKQLDQTFVDAAIATADGAMVPHPVDVFTLQVR